MIGIVDGVGATSYDFENSQGKRLKGTTYFVSLDLGAYESDVTGFVSFGNKKKEFKCSEDFANLVKQGDQLYVEVDNNNKIKSAMVRVDNNLYMPVDV